MCRPKKNNAVSTVEEDSKCAEMVVEGDDGFWILLFTAQHVCTA